MDESIQGTVGFKWHAYIKRCEVRISQLSERSVERSIQPIIRYVPNLSTKSQGNSTLEAFFVNSMNEIVNKCQEYLAITPSTQKAICELVHSMLESHNIAIPIEVH